MSVPDYQSLMLPVLKAAAAGEVKVSEVVEKLADDLALSEEDRNEVLPSGRQTAFSNRVHWAKTYMMKAGLLESTKRIVIVDGDRLAALMIRHNVGVRVEETLHIKAIDEGFFPE